MKKVAIFVDWENLRHDIKTLKVSASDFNYSNAKHIYCSAIIDRWQKLTGKTAELVG